MSKMGVFFDVVFFLFCFVLFCFFIFEVSNLGRRTSHV